MTRRVAIYALSFFFLLTCSRAAHAQSTADMQAFLNAGHLTAADSVIHAVVVGGDTAVIGAPTEDGVLANADSPSLEDSGSAYVFTRTDGGWTLQAHLTASDAAEFDHFGNSVAICGDTVVVGAQFANVGDNANQGSVYVFTRNGTAWTEQAHLIASDGAADDLFGNTVAIEGDTISVTVPQEVGAAAQRPPYVFTRSGMVWAPQ